MESGYKLMVALLSLPLSSVVLSDSLAQAPAATRSRADSNGDGLVSQDEYLAVANQRFGRMDANKDGVVDQGEVDAAAQKIFESIKARMQRQWQAADADKDGKLPKAEADKQAGARFAGLDKDQDGRLKPEDFRRRGARKKSVP